MSDKRNEDMFDQFWSNAIYKQAQSLCDEYISMRSVNSAKKRCWEAYDAFNKHCSTNYMGGPDELLDRHKVAACYTYAVMVAQILKADDDAPNELGYNLVNERLALTVGCSVLASYTLKTIGDIKEISDEERARLVEYAKQGVRFPSEDELSHGRYVDDVLRYLGFTYAEKNYNVPLLGLLFYEWEKTLLPNHDAYVLMMKTRPGR